MGGGIGHPPARTGWAEAAAFTRERNQPIRPALIAMDALTMAMGQRELNAALMHHSDRGSQYVSDGFQSLLKDNGIRSSMSGRGNCYDDACVESFFATLKTERVYRRQYRTRDAARRDLFEYIEVFYNRKRRHSLLGGISPVDYESALNDPN